MSSATEFVEFIFSIGGLVISVLAGALWLWARPQSKSARRFMMFVAVAYTLATIYGVNYALGRLLAAGYRPFVAGDLPSGRAAVVVLGSGSFTARDWNDNEFSIVDGIAASRVLEAVRVYKLVDPEWVISSGGRVYRDQPYEASGVVMRDAMLQLGVPAARVITETTSRNTHHEAVVVRTMLAELKIDHVVLVTSEIHMRRSMGTFRAAGIEAIPAIARDPFPARSWEDWIVPSEQGLWTSSSVAHEVLGIIYYAANGWYRF